jgi:S1-C subfamily serine protease
VNPGHAWWGALRLDARGGVVIAAPTLMGTPIYDAGLDIGDELRQIGGTRVSSPDDVAAILRKYRPGDSVTVEYVDRTGAPKSVPVTLAEDPDVRLEPVESTGRALSPSQRAFRAAWLGQKG